MGAHVPAKPWLIRANGCHRELCKHAEAWKRHLNWIGTHQSGLATDGLFFAMWRTSFGENGAAAFTSEIEGGAWGYTAIRSSSFTTHNQFGRRGQRQREFLLWIDLRCAWCSYLAADHGLFIAALVRRALDMHTVSHHDED
jgi:hypothetical protein